MYRLILLTLFVPALTQLSKVNDAVGDFSFALLKSSLAEENESTIHSSYSIWTALGMCLVGAEGDTLKNMEKYMNIPGMPLETFQNSVKESTKRIKLAQPESKVRFTAAVANRIYVNESYTLGKKYVNTVANVFDADAESVNFRRANGSIIQKEINDFVANTTHDLIPKLLDKPLDKDTKIALVNALYFKGSWSKPMKKEGSGKFNEHIDGGQDSERIGVKDSFLYGHNKALEATLIELPYASKIDASNPESTDRASMLIIFPDQKHKSEIKNWVKRKLNWPAIVNAIKSSSYRQVDLIMPEFEVESSFELSDVLKNMGMQTPFLNYANFNGMVDSGSAKLKISKVIHKAKMRVDENGTTAAAATAVIMVTLTSIINATPLTIDRSFVAMIILRQKSESSILPLFTAVINKL